MTAGIGILEQASPMIQELFKGTIGPVAAGGFVGLLSLFNMAGRFFWSTASDYHRAGRIPTLFSLCWGRCSTSSCRGPERTISTVSSCLSASSVVLLSMYGGGFATIPAYLRDLFGTHHVSAIHGRLLTAWSVAGVLGPVLVNYMREYQLAHGADKAGAYQTVLHVMAGLLVVGFVANLMVRPVAQKYWLSEGERRRTSIKSEKRGAGQSSSSRKGALKWQKTQRSLRQLRSLLPGSWLEFRSGGACTTRCLAL